MIKTLIAASIVLASFTTLAQTRPIAEFEDIKAISQPSGLTYIMLREGFGAQPLTKYSTVTVHYEGRLLDGTVFDSSYKRGNPSTFALNRVIPGWTEGVQLMKEGSKYQFTIPPHLAYGSRGAGNKIPPNATLIFDIELIKAGK